MKLRVGTRGSDLALAQTKWVVGCLQTLHSKLTARITSDARSTELEIETVVIQTHGDTYLGQFGDEHWPIGGFVGAIERALLVNEVDLAVHSYKDLPTDETPGLTIAAVLQRELPHDVLVSSEPFSLDAPPVNPRIGTSSPRRAAQLRTAIPGVQIVPIRGNVPTRLAKIEFLGLDGVVLAAAGLNRLGLTPPHVLALPTDRFTPAPGQGALAVQVRAVEGDARLARENAGKAAELAGLPAALDDAPTRLAVAAERSFLRALGAGCQTPAGALAEVECDRIVLFAQLFTPDGGRMAVGKEIGTNPDTLGATLANRLVRSL